MILGQSKKRMPIHEINSKIPADSYLTAIKHLGVEPLGGVRRAMTLFSCRCGKDISWYAYYVIIGMKKSCGCIAKNKERRNAKYTYSSNKLRRAYYTMISRCYHPQDPMYKWYGKRGVMVCDEWKNNPQSFFDWAEANGHKKGLTLDKDKLGNGMLYSPETCCWVTQKENTQYKRNNIRTTYNGDSVCLQEVVDSIGCSRYYIERRQKEGLTLKEIESEYAQFKKTGVRLLLKGRTLTRKDVLFISKSKATNENLAKKYGVTTSSINSIRRGATWSWLTGIKYKRKHKKHNSETK